MRRRGRRRLSSIGQRHGSFLNQVFNTASFPGPIVSTVSGLDKFYETTIVRIFIFNVVKLTSDGVRSSSVILNDCDSIARAHQRGCLCLGWMAAVDGDELIVGVTDVINAVVAVFAFVTNPIEFSVKELVFSLIVEVADSAAFADIRHGVSVVVRQLCQGHGVQGRSCFPLHSNDAPCFTECMARSVQSRLCGWVDGPSNAWLWHRQVDGCIRNVTRNSNLTPCDDRR